MTQYTVDTLIAHFTIHHISTARKGSSRIDFFVGYVAVSIVAVLVLAGLYFSEPRLWHAVMRDRKKTRNEYKEHFICS